MPAPAITCLLVAAVIIAQADVLTGAAVAIFAGVLEFMLPALTPEEQEAVIHDGKITRE